jgi:hypothetical protein
MATGSRRYFSGCTSIDWRGVGALSGVAPPLGIGAGAEAAGGELAGAAFGGGALPGAAPPLGTACGGSPGRMRT